MNAMERKRHVATAVTLFLAALGPASAPVETHRRGR
jgi:hypothetical protein